MYLSVSSKCCQWELYILCLRQFRLTASMMFFAVHSFVRALPNEYEWMDGWMDGNLWTRYFEKRMNRIGISQNIFPQHGDGTNITSKTIKKLRLLKCCVTERTLLYGCESWTVSQRMKSQLEATEMWLLRRHASCILHGLIKCQIKKYFKEPIHEEFSWRLLLTDKSDLWDISWERVSWKRLHWPG